MADHTGVTEQLSPQAREGLERVLTGVAERHDAFEQWLKALDALASSGVLAAVTSMLEDFDENFNAIMRPEVMGMVANMMMLMGVLSEMSYEPFFHMATRAPAKLDEEYARFQSRKEPLGVGEAMSLMRTPEFAAALEMMVAVMRAMRGAGETSGSTTR